jgi:hypothetical protein
VLPLIFGGLTKFTPGFALGSLLVNIDKLREGAETRPPDVLSPPVVDSNDSELCIPFGRGDILAALSDRGVSNNFVKTTIRRWISPIEISSLLCGSSLVNSNQWSKTSPVKSSSIGRFNPPISIGFPENLGTLKS